ncbi:MAG: SRPBCC family protein [Bacteroidia bacterium]
MKYSVSAVINKPREEVVAKFDNADNMKHWMRGLQSFEHLEGEPGKAGAKSKMVFKSGKRTIEMVETIVENKLPDYLHGSYDAKGVHNTIKANFEDIDGKSTRYVNEQEFHFAGLAMKFMGWIMPGAFKKQSMIYLNDFKAFVEEGTSVAE